VFEPSYVFDVLYLKILDEVTAFPEDKDLLLQIHQKVRDIFCQQNMAAIRQSVDSATSHRLSISHFETTWRNMSSNRTCFVCLARRPENTLTCGHSLCDPCTIAYGVAPLNEPWNLLVAACPLCNTPNELNFILKPYTAGIRGLIFDGGSPQDVIILKTLEAEMQLTMPIREHFDIVNGAGKG